MALRRSGVRFPLAPHRQRSDEATKRPGFRTFPAAMHLDLDSAWRDDVAGLSRVDRLSWGPRLRYCARRADMEEFWNETAPAISGSPFLLYGSGDFHHLTALWLRRCVDEPLTLVVFDNHPDWDVRPPRWGCGGWVNRALELSPNVLRASIWGLGNFEPWWPSRTFANHRALRAGRLEVHVWADERRRRRQPRLTAGTMRPDNWRERFDAFAISLAGQRVYVSVDLDCLREDQATTNWEAGKFTRDDVAWAIERLHAQARVVGGDVCGAWSEPRYACAVQKSLGWLDRPRLQPRTAESARAQNEAALARIWPALNGVIPSADA